MEATGVASATESASLLRASAEFASSGFLAMVEVLRPIPPRLSNMPSFPLTDNERSNMLLDALLCTLTPDLPFGVVGDKENGGNDNGCVVSNGGSIGALDGVVDIDWVWPNGVVAGVT